MYKKNPPDLQKVFSPEAERVSAGSLDLLTRTRARSCRDLLRFTKTPTTSSDKDLRTISKDH